MDETKKPRKDTATDHVIESQATRDLDILMDMYKLLGQLFLIRQRDDHKILVGVNATNGYVQIGWMAEEKFKSKAPDAPFQYAPMELQLPTLWSKEDAVQFDQQVYLSACSLSEDLYSYSHYETNGDRDMFRGHIPYEKHIPSDVLFEVHFFNHDDDGTVRQVIV